MPDGWKLLYTDLSTKWAKSIAQVIAFEEIHNYGHPGGCGSNVAGLPLGSGEEGE